MTRASVACALAVAWLVTPIARAAQPPVLSPRAGAGQDEPRPGEDDPQSRLVKAAMLGDAAGVRAALADGADINGPAPAGGTALTAAALHGHVEIMDALLAAGAGVAATDQSGASALMIASSQGLDAVAERLIARGADPREKDTGGTTPLMAAASAGRTATVKLLLAKGAEIDAVNTDRATALMAAAFGAHAETAAVLIAAGADVNSKDVSGRTALMAAALSGSAPIARALIGAKADLGAVDASGSSALIYAAANGHLEFLELVQKAGLTTGADAALAYAARGCHVPVVRALLAGGAKPAVDLQGVPAVMLAAGANCADVVELLIARGASVDAAKSDGTTALMEAAGYGFVPMVELLLRNGADMEMRNKNGQNAWSLAAMGNHREIVGDLQEDPGKPLIRRGAVPDAQRLTAILGRPSGTSREGRFVRPGFRGPAPLERSRRSHRHAESGRGLRAEDQPTDSRILSTPTPIALSLLRRNRCLPAIVAPEVDDREGLGPTDDARVRNAAPGAHDTRWSFGHGHSSVSLSLSLLDHFARVSVHLPEPADQARQVGRQGRLEPHHLAGHWVPEPQFPGVQGLPWKLDRPEPIRSVHVPLLPHERMTPQPRLQANLVAFPGDQPHFYERGVAEAFDHPVVAERLLPTGIPRVRLLLNERLGIPDQPIAPGAGRRRGMTVDDGEIHALGLVPPELIPEQSERVCADGEHDQTRCVAVDAMDDERPSLAARPQVVAELVLDGRRPIPAREWYRQETGRLVDDDQGVVLVDDLGFAGTGTADGAPLRRTRAGPSRRVRGRPQRADGPLRRGRPRHR